ncbi:3-coathanger stack domain-containing protein [uncultured Arcticibacterium sp.]|uniref:3-coathanger stack domain-containing protein n=1 Tax=uncultured Arcticibacterium sp. TaxID=2173042 RepID=UPI0030F5ABC4
MLLKIIKSGDLFRIAFFISISFSLIAQDKKEPLKPYNSVSTIYDSCQVVCNLFPANKENLVATEELVFPAITNNSECYEVPNEFNPGCLLSYNNSKWFLVKVLEGDSLKFNFQNSKNYDIDAAIWGPIAGGDLDSTCFTSSQFPKSCDYSAINPTLNLYQPDSGSFYLLTITNYSNDDTDILLNQPTGGSVIYSYFCSENSSINSAGNGNQNLQAINSLHLSFEINPSTSIIAKGGNSIELLPGFETDSTAVFSANIGECINTSQNYNPDSSEVVCENFHNHGNNIPHLYTNASSQEMVGTIFAISQPEYRISSNEPYLKMTKIGVDKDSSRFFWGYRHPYTAPSNIHLRTNAGCPAYPDERTTSMEYLYRDERALPTLDTIENYANLNTPFHLSNDLYYGQDNNYDLWNFYLKGGLTNLTYRINGGSWRASIDYTPVWEPFTERYLDVTRIEHIGNVPKDFYIDFTTDHGETIDRYLVTRSSCGGHFCGTTVFNRLADSTVIVNVFQGDINVDMQLGDYQPFGGFGTCFNLGTLPEGDYSFPYKSAKGDFVLDQDVFVRVKFD